MKLSSLLYIFQSQSSFHEKGRDTRDLLSAECTFLLFAYLCKEIKRMHEDSLNHHSGMQVDPKKNNTCGFFLPGDCFRFCPHSQANDPCIRRGRGRRTNFRTHPYPPMSGRWAADKRTPYSGDTSRLDSAWTEW